MLQPIVFVFLRHFAMGVPLSSSQVRVLSEFKGNVEN